MQEETDLELLLPKETLPVSEQDQDPVLEFLPPRPSSSCLSFLPPWTLSSTHPHVLYLVTPAFVHPHNECLVCKRSYKQCNIPRGQTPRLWLCLRCDSRNAKQTSFLCIECQALENCSGQEKEALGRECIKVLVPELLADVLVRIILSYTNTISIPAPTNNKGIDFYYWFKQETWLSRFVMLSRENGETAFLVGGLVLLYIVVLLLGLVGWREDMPAAKVCFATATFGLLFQILVPLLYDLSVDGGPWCRGIQRCVQHGGLQAYTMTIYYILPAVFWTWACLQLRVSIDSFHPYPSWSWYGLCILCVMAPVAALASIWMWWIRCCIRTMMRGCRCIAFWSCHCR